MSEFKTKMERGFHGWRAKSEASLGHVPAQGIDEAGERFVILSTSKGSNGQVTSFASVIVRHERKSVDGDHTYFSETHAVFGDYAKTVKRFPDIKRVTEKALNQAHAQALELFPQVIEEARAMYRLKENVA